MKIPVVALVDKQNSYELKRQYRNDLDGILVFYYEIR